MKMTALSLSLALDEDKQTCYGLLKFLGDRGIAPVTQHKVEGQKGKPTCVFDVPDDLCQRLQIPSDAEFNPAWTKPDMVAVIDR